VEILNPLTEDQTVMRTSLIPGLLKSMHRNISRQVKNIKLFEIGKIFIQKEKADLPNETEMLSTILSGADRPLHWDMKETSCDYYDMKGVVEGLVSALKIGSVEYTSLPDDQCRSTRPGHTAQILQDGDRVGLVGELHPDVLKAYNLKQTAFLFELDLTRLYDIIPEFSQAEEIPIFPATSRDVTIIIDQAIEVGKVMDSVRDMGESRVESLFVFDIFTGDAIPEGKKSISFRIIYRSLTETLEDEVINQLHKDITFRVIDQFDAGLPE